MIGGTLRSPSLIKSGYFWFAVSAAFLLVVGSGISVLFWDWLRETDSPGTTIRNSALVIAGAIALPLAVWRGVVAERQAAVAQRSLLQDRYQKGAEMHV